MALAALFRKSAIEPPPAIEAAALRSDRFRLERESEWRRLDAIVTALEKKRPRRISDEDLLALPVLYRKAASSLAVARETTLDAALLAYLESLVRRAWFQVYGPRTGLFGWLRRFLFGGWSRAVREILPEIGVALAVMLAGVCMGWLLVSADAEWFHALVPPELAGDRQPGADPAALRESLSGAADANGLSVFAAYLFSNNASVAILAFALGFAFGIPTMLLLAHNMALLGALLFVFAEAGLAPEFAAWLSVHGTTEIAAILLAGAAGLHIGRSMAFPGNRAVLEAAASAGRRAAVIMTGVVLMMVIAGLLEAYARQLVTAAAPRAAIGGAMLLFWLAYFGLVGRGHGRIP